MCVRRRRPTCRPYWRSVGVEYRGELQYPDRIHLRNRDYDPTTGTFLTPDPLGVGAEPEGRPTSGNLYAYVGNDPLNYQDPLGLCRMLDGDFYFEQNQDLCQGLADQHGTGGCKLAGGSGDLVVPYWDPTWEVNDTAGGGCEVPGFEHVTSGGGGYPFPAIPGLILGGSGPSAADYVNDAWESVDGWVGDNITSNLQICPVVYCWTWDESGDVEGRWSLAASLGGSSGLQGDGQGTKGCVGVRVVGLCHSPSDPWWKWKPSFAPGAGIELWARSPD